MRPLLPAILAVTLAAAPAAAQVQREVLAMGTRLALRIDGRGHEDACEAALAEVARIEAACSTWNPDSAWSRLNAEGRMQLDPEWTRLLADAKVWSTRTDGAFDPALGRLIDAWGLRRGAITPVPAELEAARDASGARLMGFDGDTVVLMHGAWVEEGGFLKGYALDRMKARLTAGGAPGGLLDFGGQLLAWGSTVRVSIADPKDRNRARISFHLHEASLSSSGTSERGRHILDPLSGRPCEAWGSVAVVMPSGFDADCLSTALYVMGPDRGLAWAESHGVAAAFLPNAGAPRLSKAFRALHPTLTPTEQK
ncbi:MAG TPA: FAD:protein FMN transferase [Holophagaceae bacterium]|nr:FAD:protein FMN transferase [Holophagaceae bacterium]